MTTPTIDTTTVCPPHLPCPAWCNGRHYASYHAPDGRYGTIAHYAAATGIRLDGLDIETRISVTDTWSDLDAAKGWARTGAQVILWLGGIRMTVDPEDAGTLRLCDLASLELGKLVRDTLTLAHGKQVGA